MTDFFNASANNTASPNAANTLLQTPSALANYLVDVALRDRAAAYLQVTAEGYLVSSGGQLQKYGLQAIAKGDYIGKAFYPLEGFFPLERTEVMQHVQLDIGPIVDVHLVLGQDQEAGWVLLLDTTVEAQRAQRLQQKGNDLSLLRQQYNRLINQHLTPSQQGAELIRQIAEKQRVLSVLIVKLCDAHGDWLSVGKPATLRAVNASLSLITQIAVEEGGLINHAIGGTVAAFFGLLPGQQAACEQALCAARRVLQRLMAEAPHHALEPLADNLSALEGSANKSKPLGVGASITSGTAAAGILHGQGSQWINAVGDPIQSAAQMGCYIQPGTVAIDQQTFRSISQAYKDGLYRSRSYFKAELKAELQAELKAECTAESSALIAGSALDKGDSNEIAIYRLYFDNS